MKNTIVETLKNMLNDNEVSELTKAVINDVFNSVDEETDEEIKRYMKEISEYGCSGGSVSSLIYYSQTKEFFTTHMDDIFNLYNELKSDMGCCPLGDKELEYNILSWFSYEVTIQNLLNEIEE